MEKLGKAIEILKNVVFILVVIALLLNAFGQADIDADCPRCMPIFEKLIGLSDANAATYRAVAREKLFSLRYSALPY